MRIWSFALGLGCLMTLGLKSAQALPTMQEIDQTVQAEMQRQNLVGMSIAVIEEGHIKYLKPYGYANLEKKESLALKHRFRWASVSKPVTAVMALQLAEQKKLHLDQPISQWLPDFPRAQEMTTRQLLGHLAGIGHYADIPNWSQRRKAYRKKYGYGDYQALTAVEIFKHAPLVGPPGKQYHYSSFSYNLAGAVIEKAGQENFVTQFQKRVAQPLMLKTMQPDYMLRKIPYRVTGYYRNAADEIMARGRSDVDWKLPGGGFISDIRDMAQFALALSQAKLISPTSQQKMFTPMQVQGKSTGYGLGVGVSTFQGKQRIEHLGGQQKTRTLLSILPKQQSGIVLMCNSEWAQLYKMRDRLYPLLFGQKNDDESRGR